MGPLASIHRHSVMFLLQLRMFRISKVQDFRTSFEMKVQDFRTSFEMKVNKHGNKFLSNRAGFHSSSKLLKMLASVHFISLVSLLSVARDGYP